MREAVGNLWDYHKAGWWVAITTNGSVRRDRYAVMGRGVAREAAVMFPLLQKQLGESITLYGIHVRAFHRERLFAFPVKFRWAEVARITLIEASAFELVKMITDMGLSNVAMVRPGCGNGRLSWAELVKPTICSILDDRFLVVEKGDA